MNAPQQNAGPAAVRAKGLSKTFRDFWGRPRVRALAGIDLEIAPGEVFGLLGPNGAGKTTTIRMLTTLSLPSSGTGRIAGHDILADPLSVKRSIGVIHSQLLNLDIDLTLAENLEYHGRLHRMERADREARTEELVSSSSDCGTSGTRRSSLRARTRGRAGPR